MDRLFLDFRRGPVAYLSSRSISSQDLVDELLQLLMTTSDKNDSAKLAALRVFQEAAPKLLSDPNRLEATVTTLKTIFQQFRNSGSPLVCSQILCSMTSIVIEMELFVEKDHQLIDLIQLLLEVAGKMKSETHLLLRATACDCLRELELAYPGILSSKIGHFYAMSQSETAHVFQHYLLLLATVLEHTVRKHVMMLELGHTPDSTLSDLLSHADTLTVFSLPEDFKQRADHLLKLPTAVLDDRVECGDVRRAVSFVLDNYHLLTPPCLVLTLNTVIATVQHASLTPKILKSLLLHYLSCQDILPFYLVLLLKWRFGGDICSDEDADSISMWFNLMASHPSLPAHHRELMLAYNLQWPHETLTSSQTTTSSETNMEIEESGEEKKDFRHLLFPSIFDTYSIFCYKIKALNFRLEREAGHEEDILPLPHLLSTVLKQVQYGAEGAPVVTLFRLLFSYYTSHHHQHHTSSGSDICKLVADVVKDHQKYIPHMIDFITAIESAFTDSPVPLRLLADYLHHISTSPLPPNLPLCLLFLKQASLHPNINPLVVIQFLSRVLKDVSLCNAGSWDVGSAILNIVNTIMRSHHTDFVFKGLTELLELMSTNYKDIDIQDRARFYHQLILSVSGKKLSAILALASDNSAGSTLSDIVEARIADNTYPSASPIKTITEKFLSLTRVGLCEDVFYKDIQPDEDSTLVEGYMTSLEREEGREKENISFSLQYKIQFLHCPSGVSSRIYAAVLNLSTDAPYHPCPDVYVPYLACVDCGGLAEKSSEKCVQFTFFPKQPVPAIFRAQVIFTTDDGVTCVCAAGEVEVAFEDLFQPIPLPKVSQQLDSRALFDQMWSRLECSQNPVQGEGRFGVLSSVHLDMSCKEWDHRAKRLQLLQIPAAIDDQERVNGGETCYLVFLPPHNHLLLRVCSDDCGQGVLVHLATDHWRCLGLVNDYLHHMTTGTRELTTSS